MYILVNEELEMSKGKVAAQVGHAVNVLVYNMLKGREEEVALLEEYMDGEIKKIILSAPERLLLQLEELGYCSIIDKGYTEIKPNSLTCVNLGIIDKNQLPATAVVNRLKLYK
jgi:PTH2 family peptidyl-tRNA hydrolase